MGCEALSSYSRTGFGSSGNTATPQWSSSVKQPCDEGRGMRKSYKLPQRCHAASKRKARSEGPRPRGPSGAGLREKIDLRTAFSCSTCLSGYRTCGTHTLCVSGGAQHSPAQMQRSLARVYTSLYILYTSDSFRCIVEIIFDRECTFSIFKTRLL